MKKKLFDWKSRKKIYEWCDNCGQEVKISIKGGNCKFCGHFIFPCSLCDMDKVNCNECEFEREVLNSGKNNKN